jgi:hypothetical protein
VMVSCAIDRLTERFGSVNVNFTKPINLRLESQQSAEDTSNG